MTRDTLSLDGRVFLHGGGEYLGRWSEAASASLRLLPDALRHIRACHLTTWPWPSRPTLDEPIVFSCRRQHDARSP